MEQISFSSLLHISRLILLLVQFTITAVKYFTALVVETKFLDESKILLKVKLNGGLGLAHKTLRVRKLQQIASGLCQKTFYGCNKFRNALS